MTDPDSTLPASEQAMRRFVALSPGLQDPRRSVHDPRLPTLPDLKMIARERRAAGHDVIDQSAGDIDDVGEPLADAFSEWVEETRDRLVGEGYGYFARTPGNPFGFPANYQQQFPVVTEALARSWGVQRTPCEALQTLSGRTVIDYALRGLVARARAAGKEPPYVVLLDPFAWSGYRPLAADLDLSLIHGPARPDRGLATSAESLAAALELSEAEGLTAIGAVPILPSNPTGVGLELAELGRLVETAAEADVPVVVDAFYSPIAPEGHAEAIPLSGLERELAPEALGYLGIIVGETKVTSSQNKTGSLLWMAPAGRDEVAQRVLAEARRRMRATNGYPRAQEALVAYALHTFPDGIHAAMGPRYRALEAARVAMREAFDELGLPLSVGGSFYGTAALVDDTGETLVRDADGRPLTDPRAVSATLIERFGLVGAPGGMFSPAPEAAKTARLTAAVTLEDVGKVRGILARMLDEARRHG